jgi:hypothetical protein
MKWLAILVVLGLAAVAVAQPSNRDAVARRAFLDVHRVLLSPRCRNCHPAGDAPLQRDAGIAHAQNISRASVRNGLPCAACHRTRNGDRAGWPPGAPNWQLPPRETPMVFEGRSPAELCAQLKDPRQTHGRDLEALLEHVAHDPLVKWGWAPGAGRTLPPLSHADFVAAMQSWIANGAACP